MFKVAAIAAFGLSLVFCVGNAAARELAMPTGDFARSGSGGGSGETEATTAPTRDADNTGAMRETAARDADASIAHDRMLPDDAATTGTESTHAARGTDSASSSVSTPSHKPPHNAHWQSLLPGVMK